MSTDPSLIYHKRGGERHYDPKTKTYRKTPFDSAFGKHHIKPETDSTDFLKEFKDQIGFLRLLIVPSGQYDNNSRQFAPGMEMTDFEARRDARPQENLVILGECHQWGAKMGMDEARNLFGPELPSPMQLMKGRTSQNVVLEA